MTKSNKSVKICANLGGGIMQKEQGTMAIEAVRKYDSQYVNQEYRDKMVSMGNRYFQKMHRELLKEYKEKLLENLKKFQNPETITREELLTSIDFLHEVNSAIEELEHYYADSRVRTVKKDIADLRGIIDLYQDVYDLDKEFEAISNRGTLSKAEEMVAYDRIQRSVSQLQDHLIEKGILVPEIEESTNVITVTEGEVAQYKETLKNSLEMIQNLKDVTVLDLFSMIQDYFEIEDKKDAFDSLYQSTEDMSVRVDILYIVDALESFEKVLPLASHFDKMNLDTKIGDYLNSVSSKEREEIEEEILKIESSSKKTEDDYDEDKLLDFDSVLKDVNTKLDNIQNESIDDVIASLENDGMIPVEESLEVQEESSKDVKVSMLEKRRLRKEARRKIRMHSRNLKRARREYLKQIKNLQGQLNHNLTSGLTFMFVKEYRNHYYQDKLKTIRNRIERKYGSVIARQLKKDSKIQMGRKRILTAMKQLREGFDELLNIEVEKSDGTITNLLEAQNLSEVQFQLMMETVPILVDTIEENMRMVRFGGRVKPMEHHSTDLEFEYLEEEPFQIEEIEEEVAQEEKIPVEEVHEEVAYEEEIPEDEMYDEIMEYPDIKPTRTLMRNSNYHYNTCKILLGLEKRNLRGDEFEQICHRLSKELKAKRNLVEEDGKLWYAYKCSVEEINNKIRKLRFASNIEIDDIIEKIHEECKDFISYFEAYQEHNHKTFKEKIENFYTSTLEDIREIISGDEYDEASEFKNPDYDLDFEFINIHAGDEKPLLERVEAQEVEYTPRDLKELDVISVVRNLSIHDDIVEQGTYRMEETAKEETPIIVLGVKSENTYTPLIDLATIEAQIRFLAQQEDPDEEVYQKAIS